MAPAIELAGPFLRRARDSPDRPALWAEGATTSYGELAGDAAHVTRWLAARDIGRGSRVGVLAERGRHSIAAILGTSLSGAAWVPLSPAQPLERLAAVLERAELHALVTDGAGDGLLDAGLDARVSAGRLALARAEARAEPPPDPVPQDPDDVAYLAFTSGTTGEPKGVPVTAGAVRHYLDVVEERYALVPDDRVSQFFELTFDLAVHDLFATLRSGARLVVLPPAARFAPVQFAAEQGLTVWFSVPSTAAFLARVSALRPGALPTLRLSLFCGEALPADAARRWREAAPASRVENLYGPTEATIACLVQPCDAELRVTEERGCVAIGRPFEGMHAGVVDAAGTFLPDGADGELVLAGPQLAPGYWRDPEATARGFPELEHPRLGPGRWYRTGDLARRDGDGVFHHLGRIDNQVQILGHRVELEDVETHLRAASGTDAVGAVAWPLEAGVAGGIVAFVAGSSLDPDAILAGLRARLPAYMLPRRVVALEALPLSLHGKLDRAALLDRLRSEGDGPPR